MSQAPRQSLLAPFIEDGDRGINVFCICLCEMMTIPLSPMILLLYQYEYYSQYVWNQTWIHIEQTINEGKNVILPTNGTYSYYKYQICQYLQDISLEGSPWMNFLIHMNPYDNSLTANILETYIDPILYYPRWIASIIYRAPRMYIDYYYYGIIQFFIVNDITFCSFTSFIIVR